MLNLRQLRIEHPDTIHMLNDPDALAILQWMLANLDASEWVSEDMTLIAEHTINECSAIDADDPSVWQSDSGGVWDAAYCYSLMIED